MEHAHANREVSASESPAASGMAKLTEKAGTLCLVMIAGCLAVTSLAFNAAHAQDPAAGYPRKAVRVIVHAPPGGGADIVARLIGQQLGKSLGQTFLVDNRPGAAGIIGTELVAKAQADGYTLLLGTTGALANNPLLYAKLPYDSVKDFAPITNVADAPFVMGWTPPSCNGIDVPEWEWFQST